jgi:deaminated glutathione amidase
VRVAVAQFASTKDKARNRELSREYVHRAADSGAELVVLPEAAMHPFGHPRDRLDEVAEPVDGPYGTELAKAAGETGTTVLAGMFESVPGESVVYNTVLAVGPGDLLGMYRKLHLFDALGWAESERVRPGEADGLLTVEVGDLTVGVLTCYDLRFPEIARALVDAGAGLLALPAAWVAGPLKEHHWETLIRARAIENTAYVAAAAQPPPDFAGHSTVLDPMGVTLASVGEVAGLAVADVSVDRLDRVRAKLPVLEHRRYTVVPRPAAASLS